MNIDNPAAILAVTLFVLSGVASVFGPAHWNTARPKPRFALIGGLLLIVGFFTFLYFQS